MFALVFVAAGGAVVLVGWLALALAVEVMHGIGDIPEEK